MPGKRLPRECSHRELQRRVLRRLRAVRLRGASQVTTFIDDVEIDRAAFHQEETRQASSVIATDFERDHQGRRSEKRHTSRPTNQAASTAKEGEPQILQGLFSIN